MAAVRQIEIDYRPRQWARGFHASFARWKTVVIHRRGGKTTATLNEHIRAATSDAWETKRVRLLKPELTDSQLREHLRVRHYGHIFPSRVQAKLVAWEMLKYYASFVPGSTANESELRVDFPCPVGHVRRVQLFGIDRPDALRGPAFAGLCLDEYGDHPPGAFGEVLSKALADHLGYCIFAGTIKGKNQLYRAYKAGLGDPEWFTLWRDIDESIAVEDDAATMLLQQALDDDRKLVAKGEMTQEEFDQEWYLSTEAAIKGAYFAKQLAAARRQKRIGIVPFDPALPIDTDWDLGVSDAMSIWFSQSHKTGQVGLIHYYEATDEGLPHYIAQVESIRQDYGGVWGQHFAPHDIRARELTTGKTRLETAARLGTQFAVTPSLLFADGIDAARQLFPRCYFNEATCEQGIEALTHYRKAWNERLQQFDDRPVHDWACVTADTEVLTRYGACQIQYLPEEGEVLTPCGWKRYEHPRLTRRNAPLVAVRFDDGLTVRCTPDHLFLTVNGWRFAGDLQAGSLIQSSSIRSRSTSTVASTESGRKSVTSRAAAVAFTATLGWLRLVRFLMDAISTIETATPATTPSRTWSACRSRSTCRLVGASERRSTPCTSLRLLERRRRNGTLQKLVASGIGGMPSAARAGRSGAASHGPVINAGKWSRCWSALRDILRSTAQRPARPLRIAHVKPLPEREDVWCLTVPDGHVWSLVNGAVTHNSHGADAFRGLSVRHKTPVDKAKRPPRRAAFVGQSRQGWMA